MWIDVESSPAWDTDVEWSRLDGPFRPGTQGAFKLKGGPELRFELDRVELLRAYTNTVRLPGLRVRFTHEIEPIDGRLHVVRHGAELAGPLGWLLAPLLLRKLRAALEQALQNMVRQAEHNALFARAA
jgi:hypothetical protein